MTYLVIMFLLAGAGIFRLWLMQRRERSHLDSVDGFKAGLEAISADAWVPAEKTATTRRTFTETAVSGRPRGRSSGVARAGAPVGSARDGAPRTTTLDPARREAAKRRLEARRRAVHH